MLRKYFSLKSFFAIIIILVWAILLDFMVMTDKTAWSVAIILILPAIILSLYLFIDHEIFLYAIIFFVPVSLKLDLPGGFAVAFPSEVLALMMICYFILNSGHFKMPDKRIFSHPLFQLLVIQLVWLLISSMFSTMLLVSLKRTFITAVFIFVFYFLFFTKFDKLENILKFYLFYALGLMIPVGNTLINHSQYHFRQQVSYMVYRPFFAEHTVYGAALAFILPMLFYLAFFRYDFRKKIVQSFLFKTLFFICLIAEFLSYSRAAWISLAILPLFIVIFRLRIPQFYMSLTFILILIVVVLNIDVAVKMLNKNKATSNRGNLKEQVESVSNVTTDISNLERINRWKCAIKMFKDKPITGFGPGTYQFKYGPYQSKQEMTYISTYKGDRGNAHSEYLGYLSESGFPGFFLFLGVIFMTIKTSLKIIYSTSDKKIRHLTIAIMLCMTTFYIHSLFNGFLDNEQISSLYYGSVAAVTAIDLFFYRTPT